MKVYIAGPFFNEEQLNRVNFVELILDAMGVDYFSPRLFLIPDRPDLKSSILTNLPPADQRRVAKAIYKSNIENLHRCDTIVAIRDDHDDGTTFELGYAVCLAGQSPLDNDKYTIITVNFSGKGSNVMLRECVDSHASTKEELVDCLKRLKEGKPLVSLKDTGAIE